MPIVTIKAPHKRLEGVGRNDLTLGVQVTISETPNLRAKLDHVSVFMPFDLTVLDKVIVEIVVYARPYRTDDVIKEMSSRLKKFLEDDYFPGLSVGIYVKQVNPRHCVSSHD